MSDLLRAFLTEWLRWAEDGEEKDAEEVHPTMGNSPAHYGLCANWSCYVDTVCRLDGQRNELGKLFEASGLDPNYPFGQEEYEKYSDADAQHEDPSRLAWVKEQLSK